MKSKTFRRISSGLLSLILVLQVLVQPVMAVQSTNDLPSETKTEEMKNDVHSETIISPAIKKKLSPLELNYVNRLEDDSFAFLRGPFVVSSEEDFDIKDYTFVEKDGKGKVSIIKGEELEEFSNIDELNKTIKEYREDYELYKEEKLQELEPVEALLTINYKEYDELSVPLVINDLENKYESTKNETLTLKRDEEELTKEIFINSFKDLEELLLNFKSEEEVKDLDIIKVEKVYSGEEDEDTITVEEVFKEVLEEAHEDENKVTSLNLDELDPGYKYIFTLSSKEVKDESKILTEITSLEKDQDEKEVEELGKTIIEEEKETEEATDATEATNATEATEETDATEATEVEETEAQKEKTPEENKIEKETAEAEDEKVQEFEKALEETKEEIEQDPNKEEEKKGVVEGIKKLFGLTDLQKADKELKAALKDEKNGLVEIQNLLNSFEEKYELTREEQLQLMEDNGDAIKALIAKDGDENFRPHVFAISNSFDDKKFTITAPITLSTIAGPIQTSQKITLNLDENLTVKDGTTIAPLKNDKGIVIANGRYDSASNSIIYTFKASVREKTTLNLNQEVDFNTDKIGDATEITVQNSISAPGMASAKNFPEVNVKINDSNPSSATEIDSGDMELEFITEIEYFTETLTRATNEQKLFDIVKSNNPDLSEQQIRSDYVGWKINIPGVDVSGMDIREIKKDKYDYKNLNFSLYAPVGQSLENYQVVVEDGEGGKTTYSGSMTEKIGDHYVYSFSIPKAKLTDKGYNIYVVAKAPKKRQNYAVGLKVEPDKNYVVSILEKFEKQFEEFAKGNPFVHKWKDTSAANPYANGIELLDTRMVYIEPNGWQDLFPYNEFKSIDYNDNIDDTDIMKNTVSMFGNITKEGQITWTISETFPAEKLENKNAVGVDAYSAKSDSGNLGNPSVQILVPNNDGGYDAKNLGNISISELQNQIGNQPGTIVNYTFTDTAKDKEKFTTLSLDSGKKASIAYKPSLLQREEGAEKDTTGLAYLHKVQEHKDGPGYEIALSNDQAHTMKAFIPSDLSANPRYNDPAFKDTGVVVFCLNPGKPEPTRQYKFNGTITKGEWSTDKDSWAKHGRDLASLATASEAKASPLYNGTANDTFYASLYEHLLRMYWYGQEMAEEYQLDEQSYYKIIQYNLYYWLAGENYAESFRNGGGYNPNYFSSAEYSYAQELKQRIAKGKDWDKVDYDENIQFFYYGHDKSRSYQNTITGDTKKPAEKGSVTVNKIDQDGKKLPGAVFQLLDKDQKPIKTLVTDQKGVAIFDDLDYGTYYIKEVQAPKGYIVTGQLSKVEVNGEKAHVAFNVTNTKNEIEFRKVNEDGHAMEGVVFELRRNGRPLRGQDQISGQDGKFSWKELTPGYYEVVEKDISKYPKYSENQGRVVASFRVDENNKIQDKVIYYPNGSSKDDIKNEKNEGKPIGIEFTKVDLKTDKALEGAEFVLEYRKPGSSIFRELPGSRARSNSQGKLVWNNLVDGDYRVIETKAPDGDNYNTDLNLGEKATFTIEKNQNGYYEIKNVTPRSHKITNKEKPEEPKEYFGEFEFTKVDSEEKKPLQGVEFTLTSNAPVGPEEDKFDYKVSKTTDADGKIKYTKLYPGTYTLKETKQLPGYQENTKTWKVVVDNLGKTSIPDLENNKYELVFMNNDEELRNENYAYIKETLEQNPNNPNGMIYKITIKPKRELYKVVLGFDRWSGLESYALENNSTIQKSSLPKVGEEKTFTYYISIKDVEKFKKNTPTSPIGSIQLWYDEIGNYANIGSEPTFTLKSDSDASGLTITNDKEKPEPANLTIKKVDSATKEGLEGAKFRLYRTEDDARNDRSYLQEVTTNEHGYAVFDSPEIAGDTTYYVKEIAAPDGYKITSAITEVKSSATEDNTINAEIPNDKNNARFELYKKGDDGEYLAGVKFKLTNTTTNQSVELTTDGNGYLSYDKLKINTSYELEEISTVEGYTRNEAKAIIKVDASGKVTVDTNSLAIAKEGEELGLVLVATNIKKPSIDFVKQDGASKNPLYGAEFVLYKDGTEVTNSLTSSDKEGKFGFDNLEDGSYTVYETVSPDGYPYLEEKLEVASFTVKDGKVTNLKTNQKYGEETTENFDSNEAYPIYNKINEIKFIKIGKDKKALAGAKFKLDRVWDSYDDSGKLQSHRETVLENIETLEDGIIALSATKAGRYQLVETQAPDGYKQIETNNSEGGQIVAEFTVERGTLDIKNITVGNNYYQNLDEVTQPIEIVNKEEGKGKFQVNKIEKYYIGDFLVNQQLKGAKFLLKDINSGQYVKPDGTFTTSSGDALTNGSTVNYENLPVGQYELREFEAPDGYVRTINTWKVVVKDDSTTTIELKDEYDKAVDATTTDETSTSPAKLQLVNKSNEIEFTKVDSKTNTPLEGVEFEIWWDQQGKRNDSGVTYKEYVKISNPDGGTTFKTDAEGKFKLKNLGTGHYKIYEVKVPDGYKVEDKPVDNEPIKDAKGEFVNEFFVDIDGDIKKNDKGIVGGDDDVLVTTIKNTPITGKFRVQKVGENGVEKLPGAEFKLYKVKEDGQADKDNPISSEQVGSITGLVEFDDLEDGEYLLEETKAPDGYTLSKAKWNITIKEGKVNIQATDGSANFTRTDDTLTLNVVNKKPQGRLKLIKVDEEDNRLSGAKFKLTGVTDKNFMKEVESNENGEIIFEELPAGQYTLEETKAAKGYITNRDLKWDVVVNEDGKTTITVQPSTSEKTEQSFNNLFVTTSYAAENGETPGTDSGNEGTTDQGATEETKIEPSEIDDLTGKDEKLKELNSSGYLIVNADENKKLITTIKVVNKKGIFPSTGGIGAAIFAITGLSLMTVAYIGYKRKREIE